MADSDTEEPPRRRSATPLPLPRQVALLLQGGGALGSFQAGVFERLDELSIDIHWVAGISIGAVNAAIIAGNPPHKRLGRLKKFWRTVSGGMPNMILPDIDHIREAAHLMAAGAVATFGVPGMFRPRLWPAPLMPEGSAGAISFYDSAPLKDMLDACVDWDLLNDGPVRLSVGAVDVETGNFAYWDTRGPGGNTRIDARHIMASGALPPGLPPIEIDGRWYWDGGIVSNTPLAHVLDHQSDDMLIFQVDLFPAEGPMPRQMTDVYSRTKDIQYSSRTRQVTDQYLRLRREHKTIEALLKKLPSDMQDDPDVRQLRDYVDVGAVNIVHLIYRSRAWESGARDFEFSRSTMLDHWAQGRDAVEEVMHKGDLIARNILDGKSATFDLDSPDHLKEKTA
ncbi:patatin-like phospholipase family protein [Sphingobium aromaticiconvertens]|uniref:patatin-like phospholipase family protein n=1 Tax=Sphingobium aromaticiconvertens TaxID=365341 RepID=UPI003019874A